MVDVPLGEARRLRGEHRGARRAVDLALAEDGVLGARLTGAGFGDCAVALADVGVGVAEGAAERIVGRYRDPTGRPGSAFVCAVADGVRIVPS